MKNILLTGGTGYIGSHTAVELLKAGMSVIIVDNLSNSDADVVDRVEHICGCRPTFYQADCCCAEDMEKVFSAHTIDVVLHFAGLKAVGESVKERRYCHLLCRCGESESIAALDSKENTGGYVPRFLAMGENH